MDAKKTAQQVLEQVGGAENVAFLTHCVTRLRFNLRSMDGVDDAKVKAVPGVVGVVNKGGQYQVIIGNEVVSVYDELMKLGDFGGKEVKQSAATSGEKKSKVSVVLDTLAGVFTPLMPLIAGAGHQAQLVGVHPLDGCPGLLGQCGIVGRHGGGHALRNEHRIHAGTALQQLGHRILAVDQALIPGLLFRCTARAAGLIFLFHSMFSFRFYRNDAAHVPQGAPHRLRRQPARRFYPMTIQGKV